MNKMRKLLIGASLCLAVSSCTVSESHLVTGNPAGNKTGVAKSKVFGNSDYSVMKAAKSAKIDKIATVDITTKIYFIFPVTKVVVTGN